MTKILSRPSIGIFYTGFANCHRVSHVTGTFALAGTCPEFFIRIRFIMHCVVQMTAKPDPLRVIAAVLLGIITGGILFLVVAMIIGMLNDMAHLNIPVTTNIAENIFSAILLAVLIIVCVAGFYWKVATTPPTEPKPED